MVAEAGRTTRTQVRQALNRMNLAGAHMLGTVLTKYRRSPGAYGYGYGYGYYGYGHGQGDHGADPAGRGGNGSESRGVARTLAKALRLIGR